MGHKSFTIWFTGLSASGKSTLANELDQWVFEGNGHSYILDGDNARLGINKDLSFSEADRTENIRRVAEICRILNDAGIIAIAALITPFQKDRAMAKQIIGDENFVEVYLNAPVQVCAARDYKGLYSKAMKGEIKNFTGVDSPYEPPLDPHITLHTDKQSVHQCINDVKSFFRSQLKIDFDK
jgi:adenylyl-sulfate kinase